MVKKRPGHVPERTCIGCGRKAPQHELVRIAVTRDGQVIVGRGIRASGRSAYICSDASCHKIAVKKLDRALRRPLTEQERQAIEEKLSDLLQGEIAE